LGIERLPPGTLILENPDLADQPTKGPMMRNRRLLLLVAILAVVTLSARVWAEENADQSDLIGKLQKKGLHQTSQFFVLDDETELLKRFRNAASLHKKVILAQQKQAQAEQKVEEKKKTLTDIVRQRLMLRTQLERPTSAAIHNKIVNAINELNDRATLLQRSDVEEKAAASARASAVAVSEKYVDLILKLRSQYNGVRSKYKKLAGDTEVAKAIDGYNAKSEKKCQLGPTNSLATLDRGLKKLESSVLTESIPLQRGSGGLWHVTVSLNGKHAQDIAIDTGASLISLPYSVAQAAGMEPTPEDPTVQCVLADGHHVAARWVVAPTVRLGQFTVKNVECTVMPPDLPNAQPLLGLSFFKHFVFKIDSASNKLILSTVEGPSR
jgi:aspartyl protease family protein